MTVLRTSVLVAQGGTSVLACSLGKAAPVTRDAPRAPGIVDRCEPGEGQAGGRSPRKRHLPVDPTSLRGKRWATSEDAGAPGMAIYWTDARKYCHAHSGEPVFFRKGHLRAAVYLRIDIAGAREQRADRGRTAYRRPVRRMLEVSAAGSMWPVSFTRISRHCCHCPCT